MRHRCLRTNGYNEWMHDDPCECECTYCEELRRLRNLPEFQVNDIPTIWRVWHSEINPGTWEAKQLEGFGANNYIVNNHRSSMWHKVVAQIENLGSFEGMKAIAACKELVPKLLTFIEKVCKENYELSRRVAELENDKG